MKDAKRMFRFQMRMASSKTSCNNYHVSLLENIEQIIFKNKTTSSATKMPTHENVCHSNVNNDDYKYDGMVLVYDILTIEDAKHVLQC